DEARSRRSTAPRRGRRGDASRRVGTGAEYRPTREPRSRARQAFCASTPRARLGNSVINPVTPAAIQCLIWLLSLHVQTLTRRFDRRVFLMPRGSSVPLTEPKPIES